MIHTENVPIEHCARADSIGSHGSISSWEAFCKQDHLPKPCDQPSPGSVASLEAISVVSSVLILKRQSCGCLPNSHRTSKEQMQEVTGALSPAVLCWLLTKRSTELGAVKPTKQIQGTEAKPSLKILAFVVV